MRFDPLAFFLWMARDSKLRAKGYKALPELVRLGRLDRKLPMGLRALPDFASMASRMGDSGRPRARRVLEGITPLLFDHDVKFAEALAIGDDPSSWWKASVNFAVGPGGKLETEPLPRDGALWRARLTKTTDAALPCDTLLCTTETIEITAEGSNSPESGGYRRYSHFLVDSEETPEVSLLADDGWIELSGDATGTQIRIYKRIVLSLPADFDEEFGSALSLGFPALLWFWGMGFLSAVKRADQNLKPPPLPIKIDENKQIGGNRTKPRIAILGGGPAGLACAWLLSNPSNADGGKSAWTSDKGLAPEVVVFEKECHAGGKAASKRAFDNPRPQDRRIEEHGLHVVMGFYENLRSMLAWSGRELDCGINETLIPDAPGADPGCARRLRLKPWRQRPKGSKTMGEMFMEGEITAADVPASVLPLMKAFDMNAAQMSLILRRTDPTDAELPKGQNVLNEKIFRKLTDPDPKTAAAALDMVRLLMMVRDDLQPTPLLRAGLALWSRIGNPSDDPAVPSREDPQTWHLQRLTREMIFADIRRRADASFERLVAKFGLRTPSYARGGTDISGPATLLRERMRSALPADSPDADVRFAGEIVELTTTLIIGLDQNHLFPTWCFDDLTLMPRDNDYVRWVNALHDSQTQTLAKWLELAGACEGFAENSRMLGAVTAGLFATPSTIQAGTFINGLARMLLNYGDKPYHMLIGGSQEALIDPIVSRLLGKANLLFEHAVTGMAVQGDVAKSISLDTPGGPEECEADAFVVAIPPFVKAPLPGLPEKLSKALSSIESRATISLQVWTKEAPKQDSVIIAGLRHPMRCAAPMTHLTGTEGPSYPFPPVYYCGDVEDDEAKAWTKSEVRAAWMAENVPAFQGGVLVDKDPPYRANYDASQRYVCADPATQSARRKVYDTGVDNLWLAGDWTRTNLSCGSIEAAVTSGLEAARSILRTLDPDIEFNFLIVCSTDGP